MSYLPLLLAFLPRLLPAGPPERPEPLRRWELLLALPVGILGGLALLLWFSRFYLPGWTSADFQAYCMSVASLREGGLGNWYILRSVGAGLLPAFFAKFFGVLDGLALGALASSMGLVAGLYLWGVAIRGWALGLATVFFVGVVAPLALVPRLLSFYPEVVAGLVLGSVLPVLAWRLGSLKGLFWGSVGVATCLLVDARGLLWALPGLLLLLGVAWRVQAGRSWKAAAILTPLILAWFLGKIFYGPTLPLEGQTALMLKTNGVIVDAGHSGYTGFRWGYSNPLRIPQTFYILARQAQVTVPQGAFQQKLRETQVDPWLPLIALGATLSLVGLRAEWREKLPMLLPALPFALAFFSAARMEPAERFLAVGLPFLPLLLALAWQTVGGAGGRRRWISLAGLLLLVTGILPSWLSPASSWRVPFLEMPEAQRSARAALGWSSAGQRPDADCLRALQGDVAAGRLPGVVVPLGSENQ